MEVVIEIVAKIAGYAVAPAGRWLCSSFYYSKNIRSVKNQLAKLRATRDKVQHLVDAAVRNGETIEAHVTTWLTKVDETTEEAGNFLEDEERANTRCSNGACLNLILRHQLSRKAKKIVKLIGEVLEIGNNYDTVSYRPAPQGIVSPRCLDWMDSQSRMSTVKRLMEALRDDKIHLIGVWGMAGVGKTTLVGEVAKQAMGENLFEEVAMANVTQSVDVKRIQGEIADMLGLKFDEETEPGRAGRLKERLSKTKDKKMILVVLDDIWKSFNLADIGIPSEGCKVLLTSRDRDVLCYGMRTQKDFGIKVLPEEEAWSLFEKMAGDCVKDPNLRCMATEVAKECAGLPLALVTVSKALNNRNLFEWKNALQQLRRPTPENLRTMQSTIYSSIELSYKHLENNEVRKVFLLCSQLGYYIDERELLKYCYGLGLFNGANTMEDARHNLSTILRILIDCCLLLDNPYSSLCMHDVVRDVAKLIASRDHDTFVVRADGGLNEWPDADALKRCRAFSVFGVDVHELPSQISDSFCEGMGKLMVLDLTKMQLSASLLSSLSFLRNLQTLCLDQCMLGDIAVIGELKTLSILSLRESNISKLPKEIGLLCRLRLLDLSHCSELKVIAPNVLSSLVALEELYMGNSYIEWEVEGLNNERDNASLAELKDLSHLIILEIHIRDASNLPKDLMFEKLERYIIFVGDVWDWSDGRGEASKTLKLKLNTSFQSEVGFKMLVKGTENLYLDELKGVESVLNESDREGFQQLKHLHIQNNAEIKYIINSRMSVIAFPDLETFILKNMTGLEEICHGKLLLTPFGNLKLLKVVECDKLKFVFSSAMARGLSQLEGLIIIKCSIMGAIVMKEEGEIEEEHTSLFPQLRYLTLEHLPKLMSFQNSLVTDAGEIISEAKPDFHMPILGEKVVFPNLKSLRLTSIGLEDGHYNQCQATRPSCSLGNMPQFQNLSTLVVECSGNIKNLLSFSTARHLVQLKELNIVDCKVMEEILVTEDLGVVKETIPKELFPRLESLILKELPMLKRFFDGSNIKFPSLMWLVIDHCPQLKTFISKPVSLGMVTCKELKEMNAEESPHTAVQPLFNEEVAFPSLEYLGIFHVDDLKIIWGNQFAVDSFYKLQRIDVHSCDSLVNIFQSDMLTRFQSLEMLWVEDCGSLQEVYELQGPNVIETDVVTAIQLKILYLSWLPNMRHVWSKDPKPIFSFHNLQRVRVVGCTSLKSLFPASVARCLMQLEQLVIVDCKVLEEIVEVEEVVQQIARFVFPQVIVLHLAVLPRLKWFYPAVHTSEWSMLKDMLVAWCPKVVIFASELLSFQESQLEIKQPLFLVDEVPFPSLEKLRIFYMDDLKIIWHNQFTADSFCNPQTMKIEFCENLTNHQETCGVTAIELKELHLLHLPKLKHIWNKDPQEIFSFQNPLEVDAMGCESLECPIPGAEDDFPALQEFMYNDNGLQKIVLWNQNSSGFVSFEDDGVEVQEVPHHPSQGRDVGEGSEVEPEQTLGGQ